MSETREIRYRGVSKERAAKLVEFGKALARLCDEYDVTLEVSTEAEMSIDVIERSFDYPEGYTFSASFCGVDVGGVWHNFNAQAKRRSGIDVDVWWFREEPL